MLLSWLAARLLLGGREVEPGPRRNDGTWLLRSHLSHAGPSVPIHAGRAVAAA